MVCELTFQMATAASIVLAILLLRGTIVLSQNQTTQRSDETSPRDVDQLTAITTKVDHLHVDVQQLRAAVTALLAEFTCHFPTCKSCACIQDVCISNDVN